MFHLGSAGVAIRNGAASRTARPGILPFDFNELGDAAAWNGACLVIATGFEGEINMVDGALDELGVMEGGGTELALVDQIYQRVSCDHALAGLAAAGADPVPAARPGHEHDGAELRLPAVIKPRGRFGRAQIHAISALGMQASCSIALQAGELVLIKIGRWGTDQFSFPCRVSRVLSAGPSYRLALEYNGLPLKVCCPRPD